MCINVYTRIIITTRGHITCKVITTHGPSIEHGRANELRGSCPLVWPFPSLQRPVRERETDTGRICTFHMTFSIVTNTCVCVRQAAFFFFLFLSFCLSLSLSNKQLPIVYESGRFHLYNCLCVRERHTQGALVCTPQLFQKSQIPLCVRHAAVVLSLSLSFSLFLSLQQTTASKSVWSYFSIIIIIVFSLQHVHVVVACVCIVSCVWSVINLNLNSQSP